MSLYARSECKVLRQLCTVCLPPTSVLTPLSSASLSAPSLFWRLSSSLGPFSDTCRGPARQDVGSTADGAAAAGVRHATATAAGMHTFPTPLQQNMHGCALHKPAVYRGNNLHGLCCTAEGKHQHLHCCLTCALRPVTSSCSSSSSLPPLASLEEACTSRRRAAVRWCAASARSSCCR
jgi:hypothetical protein